MISFGIDPGTRRIGYGIVHSDQTGTTFIDAGLLKITSTDDPSALMEIKQEMDGLIKKHKPDVAAIEKLYFATNQKTAIAVAQARGVILLALREHRIPTREYTPNEVKSGVAGYGFADKKAMLKMVRLILHMPELAVIDDASDALALAILAAAQSLFNPA
jgi:crossover junction endodeoxyribonuclease RuvC